MGGDGEDSSSDSGSTGSDSSLGGPFDPGAPGGLPDQSLPPPGFDPAADPTDPTGPAGLQGGTGADTALQDAWASGILIDNGPDGSLPDAWQTLPQQLDPFTGQPPPDSPFAASIGQNVDPFTNAFANASNNPFTNGSAPDPYGKVELATFKGGANDQLPSQSAGAANGGAKILVDEQDVYDKDGQWWGIRSVYSDGTVILHPNGVDEGAFIYIGSALSISGGQTTSSPGPTPSPTSPAQLPPLPPPQDSLPPLPPPMSPQESPPSPSVQTTAEVVILGTAPFSPDVSLPAARERAEGMGRIEWGDIKQLGKGGYNGLADILPMAVGPVLGPAVKQIDIPRATIDPRYGGAGIVGEQLSQNLLMEAAAAVPALAKLGRLSGRGFKAETVVVEHVGQNFVTSTEPWAEYQVRATGTEMEEVYQLTSNGKTRTISADGLANDYLVEAKQGYMGYWKNPFTWQARMANQARSYLAVADAMGYKGVRYAVSDADKVKVVADLFKARFPGAMKSGMLSVWWVP